MKKQTIRFLALLLAMLMVLSGCTTAPAEQTTKGNVCQSETVVTTDTPENDTTAASAGDETVPAEPTDSDEEAENTKESVPYGEIWREPSVFWQMKKTECCRSSTVSSANLKHSIPM